MDLHEYECFEQALALAKVLVAEGYPMEVINGLATIAQALIETQGFEPAFRECVTRAREHVAACRAGYNLPAKVAA